MNKAFEEAVREYNEAADALVVANNELEGQLRALGITGVQLEMIRKSVNKVARKYDETLEAARAVDYLEMNGHGND